MILSLLYSVHAKHCNAVDSFLRNSAFALQVLDGFQNWIVTSLAQFDSLAISTVAIIAFWQQ